jgi:hypothetical protein
LAFIKTGISVFRMFDLLSDNKSGDDESNCKGELDYYQYFSWSNNFSGMFMQTF